jgi:hypothetical protein
MSDQAVAVRQDQAPALAREPAQIYSLVERIMMDKDIPIERANQALEFYQKVEAEQARKAFLEAKAAFKANAPVIIKDKQNSQFNNSAYASIGNVVNTVNEALAKHGLDASWDYDQGDRIKVTCILRHVLGHAERVTLTAPPDKSGSKNELQQIKSTITYLRLATYEAATGIATKEGAADDDGNGFSDKKRKSSYAAKKDGTSETFNKIKLDFETATSIDHLRALKDQHWPEVEALPGRWYELLEDTYSLMFDELKGAEQARAS